MTALLWLSRLPAPVRGLLGLAAAVLVGWAALAVHDRTQRAIGAERERTHAALARAAAAESLVRHRDSAQARADAATHTATVRYAEVREAVRDHIAQLSAPYVDTLMRDSLRSVLITEQAQALDAADTVIAACSVARLTCEARVAARDSVIAALRTAVRAVPAPPRPRFHLGCALGATAAYDPATRRVTAGPGVTCGLTR